MSKLILKHQWSTLPPARPITQDHVLNKNIKLFLHGQGGHQLKKSHHDNIINDPFYLWSGGCKNKWAVSFTNQNNSHWNLNNAILKLRTWQSGNSQLHILLKIINMGWIMSKFNIKSSETWQITNIILKEQIWHPFDIININYSSEQITPNLEFVKAIGFSDLIVGKGSIQSSRLDWFEIWSE